MQEKPTAPDCSGRRSKTHEVLSAPAKQPDPLMRNERAKGIGCIDVHLLPSTYLGKVKRWTWDKRLRQLASRLGIEFEKV